MSRRDPLSKVRVHSHFGLPAVGSFHAGKSPQRAPPGEPATAEPSEVVGKRKGLPAYTRHIPRNLSIAGEGDPQAGGLRQHLQLPEADGDQSARHAGI